MRVDRRNLRKGLLAVGFVFGAPAPVTLAWGLPLVALGCALHLWSKGCLEQNRRLITAGPYRFVRNPFYTANLLIDAGLCVVIGHVWIAIPFAVLWALAYRATIAAEERKLTVLFPDVYPRYLATVPRLFPTGARWPADAVEGRFSFANDGLARGQEYARILGIAIGPAVVVAGAILRRDGLDRLSHGPTLAFLVSLPVLWAVKLALAEAFRRPDSALLGGDPSRRGRWAFGTGAGVVALVLSPISPPVAVIAAGWCAIALLDGFAAGRTSAGAPRARWRYHRAVVAGSLVLVAGLVLLEAAR